MTEWLRPVQVVEGVVPAKTYRILIVDDDVEVLRSLTATVRRATRLSTEIVAEANAERGIELLRRDRFDLVLADYRMPRMTGVQLLRAARELQPACRRILITGYREEDIAHEAVAEAHIHGYLLKPWSTPFVGDQVREILTSDTPRELAVPEAIALLHRAEGMV